MAHANVGLLLDEGRIIKASKTAIINVESSNEKPSGVISFCASRSSMLLL